MSGTDMGSDQSLPKNRTVLPCDELSTLRINNFRSLHFHQVHGDNVKLLKNSSVACRSEGFCKGLAFSDRPVAVCERIYIKFVEITQNWSGALRIGFTMHDPISMKSKLPRYACPDLTSTPGNWAKAIAERMARKDSILYYYVDHNGDVHYGIDSEEHGIFFGGINTSCKLWAVVDIYGNTVAVEFIDPNSLNQDDETDSHENVMSITRSEENRNSVAVTWETYSALSFHSLCGKNISLNASRTIATRNPACQNSAYVFMEQPLKLGENIIFEVIQIDSTVTNKSFVFGITACNPSSIAAADLPFDEYDLLDRSEYWVVENDSNDYKVGDIIVYNSLEGRLAILNYFNKTGTELHIDSTQPLWLFFNMIGSLSELRLVGSSSSDWLPDIVRQISDSRANKMTGHGASGSDSLCKTIIDNKGENHGSSISKQPPWDFDPELQSSTECVICYDNLVNCAFYRCGHMCLCYNCADKMWNPKKMSTCPICRKEIEDIIKIYR